MQFQFGDIERDLLPCLCLIELDAEGDGTSAPFVNFCTGKTKAIILYIGGSDIDEQHVACDATIVPPVEDLGGNILGMALVIDLEDDEVFSLLQLIGHIVVEWGETSHMVSDKLAIDIDI